MAGYITRNANIILLFLILLSAAALVGATVYFQTRFDSINSEYTTKMTQLRNVSTQLEEYQGILNKAKEELQLKGTREEELTTQYTDIKSAKEAILAERDKLASDKQKLTTNLAETTSRLTAAQNTLSQNTQQIISMSTEIAGYKSQITDLNSKITQYKDDIDDLQDERSCLLSTADTEEANC
jgi:chromosome segregation ATPase